MSKWPHFVPILYGTAIDSFSLLSPVTIAIARSASKVRCDIKMLHVQTEIHGQLTDGQLVPDIIMGYYKAAHRVNRGWCIMCTCVFLNDSIL